MKDLFGFLNGLGHKTALVTALMAAITFLEGSASLLGAGTIAGINFGCGILLLITKAVAPTGSLPKGWTTFMWITNIAALLIQVGGFVSDSGMFTEAVVLAIVKIQIVLNAVIAAVQIANTKAQGELK